MTENIRRVAEYASDIAEIVLNMNIEKTLKKSELIYLKHVQYNYLRFN